MSLKSYLKFLIQSTNEHGVHSPFVFDLITKCFYDKTNFPEYQTLIHYRESLLQDSNSIEVTDFGAGSKVFKSNRRQVSKIARTAGITPANARLLFRIVRYFKPHSILEIGTSLGLATSAMAIGKENAAITTLEGCPQTADTARLQFDKFGLKNAEFVISEFGAALSAFQHSTFDMIYFDGNHQKDATLDYFNMLLPTITNDSVWIFDDIHWSPEMESAWETIRKNLNVTVTIDTFQWGLVFFRKEQPKQDFVIRV